LACTLASLCKKRIGEEVWVTIQEQFEKLWNGVAALNVESIGALFTNGNIGHATDDFTIPTANFIKFGRFEYKLYTSIFEMQCRRGSQKRAVMKISFFELQNTIFHFSSF
jgi:hypothetical protein